MATQIRGIYITANTSINGVSATNGRGVNTRVRGFHFVSQGGTGTIHFSDTVDPNNSGNTRIFVQANGSDNLTLTELGLRFPAGVSVSVPASVVATIFIDP